MAKKKNIHANEYLRTSSGRLAGNGMIHDRYDEESGYRPTPIDTNPVHSIEFVEWRKSLKEAQPIKIYQLSDEELNKYREMEVDKH